MGAWRWNNKIEVDGCNDTAYFFSFVLMGKKVRIHKNTYKKYTHPKMWPPNLQKIGKKRKKYQKRNLENSQMKV